MRQQNRPPVDQAVLEELLTTRNSKWTLTVVLHLRHDTLRFSELRALERDGFVSRTSYATIPPRVDYALTDLGTEALKAFEAFEAFAARHWYRVLEARQLFDARDADPLEPPVLRISTGR